LGFLDDSNGFACCEATGLGTELVNQCLVELMGLGGQSELGGVT
jgi:hypothetical protein